MKSLSLVIMFCGIFAMAIIPTEAEDRELDKRYLAALAKNGRLPKFANAEKKDQPQEETAQSSEKEDSDEDYSKNTFLEDKRHLGAFLKVHGKPNFMRSSNFDDSNQEEKRNIASMARLGRLNSMRSSNFDGSNPDEKRNIASMARLGRLNSMRSSSFDGSNPDEKRNIASMARLGRLNSMRSSSFDGSNPDEKRNIASMARLGRLNSMRSSSFDGSNPDEKRNIASMARLGRLNSMRFARVQPFIVGGKRMSSEETSTNEESNAINAFEDPDCIEDNELEENEGGERPILMQRKRYVAALARSGRLPIWHAQRMWWGSKRDDSRPSWSSSRFENNHGDNVFNDMPFVEAKNKRCRKTYDQMGKRNVASLARSGKLPYRQNL